jgi:hypothetical protein
VSWQKLDQAARAGATFNIFQQLATKNICRETEFSFVEMVDAPGEKYIFLSEFCLKLRLELQMS